jgi:hypothetical protein
MSRGRAWNKSDGIGALMEYLPVLTSLVAVGSPHSVLVISWPLIGNQCLKKNYRIGLADIPLVAAENHLNFGGPSKHDLLIEGRGHFE